ncbi:MAG: aminotransferase class V-fold PLP-dependent enzyme [Bacilli bacterium]
MKDNEKEEQLKTPFLDAYVDYINSHPYPFDVPGHKLGGLETDLSRKISNLFAEYDANAPYGLDNLANPKTIIKEAEELAAKACHADHCLFSVNGTTGGVLAMLIACLDNKDKIILPRNVHKSVINGLILSGGVPIFVTPDIDKEHGVACGVSVNSMVKAMDDNPTAKAVFVINPTYFGVASDLRKIVHEAHKRNMIVITDEAHGSNFYFSDELPLSAMDCGADITSLSLHKNSGSLTQTSLILVKGNRLDFAEIKRAFTMVTSTSPNSIFLCSIDAARKEMVLRGKQLIHDNIEMADYCRTEIDKIPGLKTYGHEYVKKGDDSGRFEIDMTKLVIDVTGLGMYGYEVYKELRMKYNIQVELGEVSVILVLIGPGTTKQQIEYLLSSLRDMSKVHYKLHIRRKLPLYDYSYPISLVPPREGYDAPTKIVNLKDSVGEISGETVMAYPPGIPIIIPGEVINKDCIDLINFYRKEGGEVLKDTTIGKIKVIDREKWILAKDFGL